jgi:hypothetical protein
MAAGLRWRGLRGTGQRRSKTPIGQNPPAKFNTSRTPENSAAAECLRANDTSEIDRFDACESEAASSLTKVFHFYAPTGPLRPMVKGKAPTCRGTTLAHATKVTKQRAATDVQNHATYT